MKKKRVLILCTGNSCRSIMAEALLNARLGACLEAFSSGVAASGRVNPQARALLEREGLWRQSYRSKTIDEVIDQPFDLVVTVCDHARQTCPLFPGAVRTIHVGFEDPTGKEPAAYEATLRQIEARLLPVVRRELCDDHSSR